MEKQIYKTECFCIKTINTFWNNDPEGRAEGIRETIPLGSRSSVVMEKSAAVCSV